MSRRRGSSIGIDMFPFLSVLCSVIGVLMLLILGIISNRVIADSADPPRANAPPPPPPKSGSQGLGVSEQEYEKLSQSIQRMASHLASRVRELDRLQKLATQLEDLIASKEDLQLAPEYGEDRLLGVQIDKPIDVSMQHDENVRVTKTPVFVEVTADKLIFHPEKREYAIQDLEAKSSPLKSYLAALDKRRKREYLLLLIHPNGVPAYDKLSDYVRKEYPHPDPELEQLSRIDMGAEPFSPGWLLIGEQLAKMKE